MKISMAREVISKIENVEKDCEELIESEKEKLKLKLKEVKKKSDEALQNEREKNLNIYKQAIEEFKACVDKKTEDFKKKVEEQCSEIETKLKNNVEKAVEFVLTNFLQG